MGLRAQRRHTRSSSARLGSLRQPLSSLAPSRGDSGGARPQRCQRQTAPIHRSMGNLKQSRSPRTKKPPSAVYSPCALQPSVACTASSAHLTQTQGDEMAAFALHRHPWQHAKRADAGRPSRTPTTSAAVALRVRRSSRRGGTRRPRPSPPRAASRGWAPRCSAAFAARAASSRRATPGPRRAGWSSAVQQTQSPADARPTPRSAAACTAELVCGNAACHGLERNHCEVVGPARGCPSLPNHIAGGIEISQSAGSKRSCGGIKRFSYDGWNACRTSGASLSLRVAMASVVDEGVGVASDSPRTLPAPPARPVGVEPAALALGIVPLDAGALRRSTTSHAWRSFDCHIGARIHLLHEHWRLASPHVSTSCRDGTCGCPW